MDLVWGMTDLINGIMVFPNVIALFALRKKYIFSPAAAAVRDTLRFFTDIPFGALPQE